MNHWFLRYNAIQKCPDDIDAAPSQQVQRLFQLAQQNRAIPTVSFIRDSMIG